MKTALIFIHEYKEGAGIFDAVLATRGFTQEIIFTPESDVTEIDATEADLVLVMGGDMGVYEADRYPFLNQEIELLKKRIAADKPTLGACLGAQLIAAALGEQIFKGTQGQEIGWNPLKILNNYHPIHHLAQEKTSMFHWHGDTFALPKGARHLASSNLYDNQAFGYGENILALQFHPEMTQEMVREWAATLSEDANGSKITGSIPELLAQTDQNIDRLNVQAKLFLEEWLASVGL